MIFTILKSVYFCTVCMTACIQIIVFSAYLQIIVLFKVCYDKLNLLYIVTLIRYCLISYICVAVTTLKKLIL